MLPFLELQHKLFKPCTSPQPFSLPYLHPIQQSYLAKESAKAVGIRQLLLPNGLSCAMADRWI